ncbi:hypothetical protein C8R48DRAFT_12879 [Suillus tomentosus]|nr:hypothetical protein C8R48DRAFT_12879 [Suillus tomentosus]
MFHNRNGSQLLQSLAKVIMVSARVVTDSPRMIIGRLSFPCLDAVLRSVLIASHSRQVPVYELWSINVLVQ